MCQHPTPIFTAIAAGNHHSLGLKSNGSTIAWGCTGLYGNDGQCNVPAPNTDFVAVAAGGSHSLGLKADGSIVAWGSNGSGQSDVPTPNTAFIAVGAGSGAQYGSEGRRIDRDVGEQ